eukprot:14550171-Alexandrium_andersonii.AAC.1
MARLPSAAARFARPSFAPRAAPSAGGSCSRSRRRLLRRRTRPSVVLPASQLHSRGCCVAAPPERAALAPPCLVGFP